MPEAIARRVMLKLHLGDMENSLNENDFDLLAERTHGASGSDISVVVREALMEPIRLCQSAKFFVKVSNYYFELNIIFYK